MATEQAAISAAQAYGGAAAIGISALATAWAQANIGSAAVGAIAEDQSAFGQALILTVIPETIIIFGLVVSLVTLGYI